MLVNSTGFHNDLRGDDGRPEYSTRPSQHTVVAAQ